LNWWNAVKAARLLFLHAGEGLAPEWPWLDLLSQKFRVIAPWHPGYGNSPLIDGSGSVDDLAYLYLDLATTLNSTTRCWSVPVSVAGSPRK
jgi:pimeloyl-ACP methyl ester carboxylesterase